MTAFYENFFAPQDVEPTNRIFTPEHIILSSLLIIGIIFITHWQIIKHDKKSARKVLVVLASVMLSLEIFRIGWRTYYYGFDLRNIRFDWCNQICMALPIIILCRFEKAYPYIDILAFMGGMAVLIYPLWVFYDYGGIHVMAVQSMISHGLMVLIALLMPFSAEYRPHAKKLWKPVIGLCILAMVALLMSRLLGENYLLMRDAHGLPFIANIPFPWYWMLVGPFFLGAIYLVTKIIERFDTCFLGSCEHPIDCQDRVTC